MLRTTGGATMLLASVIALLGPSTQSFAQEPDTVLGVSVPARVIPAPSTVSAEAQKFLSQASSMSPPTVPPVKDKAAWRARLKAQEPAFLALFAQQVKLNPGKVVVQKLSASSLYEITPATFSEQNADAVILFLHGGGYVSGGGQAAADAAMALASMSGLRVYSLDYRMPPNSPFPAAVDDAVEAYRWLLNRYRPEKIAVGGPSAGGGLAAALVLKARDTGLPLPGAAILNTPQADQTGAGDTFETNAYVDVVLRKRTPEYAELYAASHDLKDPYISPVYGDFTKGFSPTLLISGTRDLLLSSTVRMHRALLKAGVPAELHVWEGMPHSGFYGAPEDKEVLQQQVSFLRTRLGLK